jgi:hypothetical protein
MEGKKYFAAVVVGHFQDAYFFLMDANPLHRGTITSRPPVQPLGVTKSVLLRYQTHLQFAEPGSNKTTPSGPKPDLEKQDFDIYRFLDPHAPEVLHSKQSFWWSAFRRWLPSRKSYADIRQSFRIIRMKERYCGLNKSRKEERNLGRYTRLFRAPGTRSTLSKAISASQWMDFGVC